MNTQSPSWYIPGEGKQPTGPFTAQQIIQSWRGPVGRQYHLLREGMSQWLPMQQVEPFGTAIRQRNLPLDRCLFGESGFPAGGYHRTSIRGGWGRQHRPLRARSSEQSFDCCRLRCWRSVLLTIVVCLLATMVRGSAGGTNQDALSARQVLDRMAKVYANCKSYRDSGVVESLYHVEVPFATAFVRPDQFYFDYKGNQGGDGRDCRYIVWRKGMEVRWWVPTPGRANIARPCRGKYHGGFRLLGPLRPAFAHAE